MDKDIINIKPLKQVRFDFMDQEIIVDPYISMESRLISS